MARNVRKPDISSGGAHWMGTYGDIVTLLLTFFVMLFAFSTLDANKWQQLLGAFSGSSRIGIGVIAPIDPGLSRADEFYVPGEGGSAQGGEGYYVPKPTVGPAGMSSSSVLVDASAQEFNDLYSNMIAYIGKEGLNTKLTAKQEGDVILLRFVDNLLFDSGKADIRPEAKEILDSIMGMFEQMQDSVSSIRIEGHTDNVPIRNSTFAGNWELSCMRAVAVLRYSLETTSIEDSKMSAVGFSEYHPVDTNETELGRSHNRRVDLVIERYISH